MPIPGDISAAFRTLADAFERMRQDGGGESELLNSLVESLMADAEMPPREVKGVPDSFLDGRWLLRLRGGGGSARVRRAVGSNQPYAAEGRMPCEQYAEPGIWTYETSKLTLKQQSWNEYLRRP